MNDESSVDWVIVTVLIIGAITFVWSWSML